MTARTLVLLLCAAAAAGRPVDDLLFEARHKHLVEGDLDGAVALYNKALAFKSLDAARQAEIRLRIALCHESAERFALARDYLAPRIYKEAAPRVRALAAEVRRRVEARLPRAPAVPATPAPDPAAARRARLREHVEKARRFLEGGNESRALYHARRALELDPAHAEARAMAAKLETRLSGVAEFVRDALSFLERWTDAHVTSVAREAESLLKEGLRYADSDRAMAEGRFREALRVLRESEFAEESERLIELQHRILVRWRLLRHRHLGAARADPRIESAARKSTLRGDYLNQLQAMLAVVSSPGREYRILPVQGPRGVETPVGWRAKPPRYLLFRDRPSAWTPALFARSFVPLRVDPESWGERGNFIDPVGGMLMARNRPAVLDRVQRALEELRAPAEATLPGRLVLVRVDAAGLRGFEREFGAFRISYRGPSPVPYRAVPARTSLDYICSHLRDRGADVRLPQDGILLDIVNGAAQTLLIAAPLADAAGYEEFDATRVPHGARHFGVLLDAFALRDRIGRMALALRVGSRAPAPPLRAGDGTLVPRFSTQEAELFVDLPPGATLAVGGLRDPFAVAAGGRETAGSLLLLWENAARDAAAPAETAPGDVLGAQIPLRQLLLNVQDDPGPRAHPERGFVDRGPLEILAERAAFLEALLRDELASDEIAVDIEEAVASVPPARREDAALAIASLEQESGRAYVVRVQAGAVRTSVFERWMRRDGIELQRLGAAYLALLPPADGGHSLKNILPVETGDPFAPGTAWPKLAVRGLQARHGLRTRTTTSPAFRDESDLATAPTRTVTEGLRVTVRPFTRRTENGTALRVFVAVETAGLESEQEELALADAVPSYRTRVTGSLAQGTIDLGDPAGPRTALVCRIAHPTASRADRLTEIIIAISVRPVP